MSSERLPGKMMLDLNGRPVIGRVIDQVSKANSVSKIILATSLDPSDEILIEFCEKEGINYFQGSLDDVAGRFLEVSTENNAESFVRICGDSPLIDPTLIDLGVGIFKTSKCDLVTNVLKRTFPTGQSVEIVFTETLRKIYPSLKTKEQREHVTRSFYENPRDFSIFNFTSGGDYSKVNLCVDTSQDLINIKKLLVAFPESQRGWKELSTFHEPLAPNG